jgi:serine/threonine-protein kinase
LPYLALEWLDGTSLHADLDEDGPSPLRRIAVRFAELMAVLAHVHSRGVVHADLKPDNVLLVPCLERGEKIKLLDFGVASLGLERWAPSGEVFGTPGYLSPEVARGAQPTVASDIYAAGALLFELVTGMHAFPGRTLAEVAQLQAGSPPRPSILRLRVDATLDGVIAKALAIKPRDRFSSADALREAAVAALVPVGPRRADQRGEHAATTSRRTASLHKA